MDSLVFYVLNNNVKYILIITYIIIISSVSFSLEVYSFSWSINYSTWTIKEIKEKLYNLQNNQRDLKIESKSLYQDQRLRSFFRDNLSHSEIKNIEFIVNDYTKSKSITNNLLLEKASKLKDVSNEKKILLDQKKELYIKMTPYIKQSEIERYLDYIKSDAKILKESKDIKEKIIVNNEILTTKVSIIEEKIKKHRILLNDSLKQLVKEKISDKINNLENNIKFKVLKNELKLKVIEKTIIRVKILISNLDNNNDKSDIISKKLEIYKILLTELEKFKERLIQ